MRQCVPPKQITVFVSRATKDLTSLQGDAATDSERRRLKKQMGGESLAQWGGMRL